MKVKDKKGYRWMEEENRERDRKTEGNKRIEEKVSKR